MRRCRKLISMIVMMAMLATMTPYQALATETPTDPAVQEVQPAAGEEVQEQEQDQEEGETLPGDQKASEEDEKDPEENKEAAPAEDSSEVTSDSDAVDSSPVIEGADPENSDAGKSEQSTQETAAPEEPGTETSADPAQEEKTVELKDGSIEAEAGGFTVKAEGKLPEGAELVLTKLSDSTVEEVGKGLDKENQTAVFAYDVTIKDAEGKIWQPEELGVKISISGLDLENKVEVSVAHILDKEEAVEAAVSNDSVKSEEVSLSSGAAEELKTAVEAAGSGDSVVVTTITEDAGLDVTDSAVSFDVDSFSAFIVFTVDFEYENYMYKLKGGSSILLSELFAALNIEQDIAEVTSVEWEDRDDHDPYELVSIEKQESDYLLTSLKAFDTEETLIVKTAAKEYRIKVTDAIEITDWKIEWSNATDGTNIEYDDDGNLVLHPYDNKNVTAAVTIHLVVNTGNEETSIPTGAVKFILPGSLFAGWNGNPADIMSTQLTTTPETATQADFIYSINDNGDIEVTNFKNIGTSDFTATFSYTVSPMDVDGGHPKTENYNTANSNWWEDWTDYYQNTVSASIIVDTDGDGTNEIEDSKELSLSMMTRAGGSASIWPMQDQTSGVYTAWQNSWGEKPADADDYFYIIWNANYRRMSDGRCNQPWMVDISANPEDNTVTIDGVEYPGGSIVGTLRTKVATRSYPRYDLKLYSYYNLGTNDNGNDKTYNNISTKELTTGRFAQSKYSDLYDAASTGYLYGSEVSKSCRDSAQGVHFAVLMRYPSNLLEKAKESGINLAEEGLEVSSKMIFTETWDSGYTRQLYVTSDPGSVYVMTGAGGGLAKNAAGTVQWNAASRILKGAQTMLANGDYVDLNYAVSESGSQTPSWVIVFQGKSPTEGEKILGQHDVITDTELSMNLGVREYGVSTQWVPTDTTYKKVLDDEDYWIRGFWISAYSEYGGTYANGAWQENNTALAFSEEAYKPIYISVRLNGESDFIPYASVHKTSGGYSVYRWDGSSESDEISRSWGSYPLPEGTVQLRAEHDSENFKCAFNINLAVRLYPTEDLRSITAESDRRGKETYVKNAVKADIYPLTGENTDVPSASFSNRGADTDSAKVNILRLTKLTNSLTVTKQTYVPAQTNASQAAAGEQGYEIAYVQLRASASAGIESEMQIMTDAEDPYKILKGTFYELLPLGTTIQEGSLVGTWDEKSTNAVFEASSYPAVYNHQLSGGGRQNLVYIDKNHYSYRTEVDPETGRTMLIIDYEIEDPGFRSTSNGGSFCNHAYFWFVLQNSYENIQTYGTSTLNHVGYVNRTEGAATTRASSQSLANANFGEKVTKAFQDIEDNNERDVFTKVNIPWLAVTVLQAGFSKTVTAPETKYSLPLAPSYISDTQVTVGNDYTYRLKLTMSSNTKSDNIVMYDILESGTNEQDTDWKGKFSSVDTSLISEKATDGGTATCAPVVYYSTTLTDKNSLTGDYLQIDLSDTSTWSSTLPDDPSTVTAIAIDCRKDSDGNDFILGNDQSLYAFVTMKAPEELPDGYEEGDVAVNGSVTALRMFETEPRGVIEYLIQNTTVELKDIDVSITKTSDPETGTEDEPRIVPGDGSGTIDYTLTIGNNGTYDYRNVVVKDTIPEGLTVSEILVGLNGEEEKAIDDVSAVTCEKGEENENDLTFTISQQHPGEDRLTTITIKTTVDALTSPVEKRYENTASITSVNDIELEEPVTTDTMYHKAGAVEVDASKLWKNADGTITAPANATVTYTLYIDGEPSSYTVTLDGTAENRPEGTAAVGYESAKWTAKFVNLPKYSFTTDEETEEVTVDEIVYTIAETVTYGGYSASTTDPVASGSSVTNTQITTTADATKTWSNADGTTTYPDGAKVTFKLYADGTATNYTVELDGTAETTAPTVTGGYESEAWKATFVNLPMYQPGTTTQIVYTVAESVTYGGYSASTSDPVASGGSITNKQITTTAEATKAWSNADGTTTYPDGAKVTFKLYADGTATNYTVELDGTAETTAPTVTGGYESEAWKATFVNLPKYQNGTTTEIVYTVDESVEYPGYESTAEELVASGSSITNKQITTTADATKAWSNADGTTTYPVGAKVTFKLYADGEATDYTVELDGTAETTAPEVTGGYESEAWVASFINLPKYTYVENEDSGEVEAKEIEYTIAETSGYTGYTASTTEDIASGGTITNTQDVTWLEGTKIWDDAEDQDGKRPKSITIWLLADGEKATSQTISEDEEGKWSMYSFTNLPIYVTNDQGEQHKVKYTIAEETIEGVDYSTTYDTVRAEGTKTEPIVINTKNSYTPELTSVTVQKIWDDANDQDGIRPETIKVQLYKDGVEEGEPVTLSKDEQWAYTWTDLDKYRPRGELLVYSVKEADPVSEYTVTVSEIDNTNTIVLTNKHDPNKTVVNVAKVWNDNNDEMGVRPSQINITLYADGEVKDTAILNEKNNWKHTFADLYVNKIVDEKGGNAIVYTVEEEAVNAYFGNMVKTEDADGITYTITNTYAPARHDPPVKKVIKGDKPGEAETFNFTITPVSNTAGLQSMPMPEGASGNSKTVSVKGEGETEFGVITFNVPGQYIYKVVEVAGSNSNYTYDKSTFQIIYDVTEGKDSLQVSIKYQKDGKDADGIVFTNEYKEPSTPSKPSKHHRSNNTGDSANGALWALMLLLAGGALAGTIWFKRRKKI